MPAPTCFQHMAVAIFKGGSVPGAGAARFEAAMKVARASLVQHGHLTPESLGLPFDALVSTPSGKALDDKHAAAPGGGAKSALFRRYFALWQASTPPLTPPAPAPPPKTR